MILNRRLSSICNSISPFQLIMFLLRVVIFDLFCNFIPRSYFLWLCYHNIDVISVFFFERELYKYDRIAFCWIILICWLSIVASKKDVEIICVSFIREIAHNCPSLCVAVWVFMLWLLWICPFSPLVSFMPSLNLNMIGFVTVLILMGGHVSR